MIETQVEPNHIKLHHPTPVLVTFLNASGQNLSSINITFDISSKLIHQSGSVKVQFPRLFMNEMLSHTLTLVGNEIGTFPLGFRSLYYRDGLGKVQHLKIPPIFLEVCQSNTVLESDIDEKQILRPTKQNINKDSLETVSPVELKDFMIIHFNMHELRDICFDLKIPFEEVDERRPSQTIISLIEYCLRHNKYLDLLTIVKKKRPFWGNQT